MNVGQEIISQILRSKDVQPYLDAGFSLEWLQSAEGRAVFKDESKLAYQHLLEHYSKHERVSEEFFRKDHPSYRLSDAEFKPSELIEEVRVIVRRWLVNRMLNEADSLERGDGLDEITARILEDADKLRGMGRVPGTTGNSWEPVDLGPYLDGSVPEVTAELGARDDGVFMLYPGKTHSLVGESEAGKSWLALHWVAQELNDSHDVGYLDFEDSPAGITARLVEMTSGDAIRKHLRYMRPEAGLSDPESLTKRFSACSLVVVDGITEAMEMVPYSGNPSDWNGRFATFANTLLNPIASRGPAVLSIDHPVKSDSASRHASGAGHKLRGLSGASYVLVNKEPFGRGCKGYSEVLVAKDRHGYVRSHGASEKVSGMVHIANLVIDNLNADVATEVSLLGVSEVDNWKPTTLMVRASKHLRESEHPVSKHALCKLMGGRKEYALKAIAFLVRDGFAEAEDLGGTRGTFLKHVKVFTENDAV